MDIGNTAWDFVTHAFVTYLFFKEMNKLKNQKLIDALYIIISTITGLVLPVFFLVRVYITPERDWIHWLFVALSICLILSYFVVIINLLFLKKYVDRVFDSEQEPDLKDS